MTVFADYLDLRSAVIEDVRSPEVVDRFDRATKSAENWLSRNLRTSEQISEATLSFSGGSATLPADFQSAIGLYSSNGYEYVQRPPQETRPTGNRYFSVSGSTISAPGIDGDHTLEYYAKIPTITANLTDTNWLLSKYPELYRYAVGVAVAKELRDVESAQALTSLRNDELSEAMRDDMGTRYSRSRIRVAGVTP